MKKTTMYTLAAVALVALLAVPFAFAQHMHGMRAEGGPGVGMMFGHLQRAQQLLGLSDQQVSDIKAIFQDLRSENTQYRESLRNTHQQIAQILLADPNNISAAQALIDQQASVERTVRLNTLKAVSKALNVLTPDQRAKLQTFLQERMQRWHKQ